MKNIFSQYLDSLAHFIFPHHCNGCGTDVLSNDQLLCAKCLYELPETNFANIYNNVIERNFYGRLQIEQATASFYFTKESLMQHLVHQLKYKGNQAIGVYLGKMLGKQLLQSNKYNAVDVIVPLPLNAKREFKRGYNQAAVICKGITEVFSKPINTTAVARKIFTETQTHHTRIERWQNMDGVFTVINKSAIEGKHILLVDDIITTGATIEACGKVILDAGATCLSVAAVGYTS